MTLVQRILTIINDVQFMRSLKIFVCFVKFAIWCDRQKLLLGVSCIDFRERGHWSIGRYNYKFTMVMQALIGR